ncbi:hypothetical protein SLE2022_316610 [Rubroshorea leprosula]
MEELRSLVERGVANRISFVTSFAQHKKGAFFSLNACVLYTPKDEHFGIVPLEAMAAHKLVLACNREGLVETVN